MTDEKRKPTPLEALALLYNSTTWLKLNVGEHQQMKLARDILVEELKKASEMDEECQSTKS